MVAQLNQVKMKLTEMQSMSSVTDAMIGINKAMVKVNNALRAKVR